MALPTVPFVYCAAALQTEQSLFRAHPRNQGTRCGRLFHTGKRQCHARSMRGRPVEGNSTDFWEITHVCSRDACLAGGTAPQQSASEQRRGPANAEAPSFCPGGSPLQGNPPRFFVLSTCRPSASSRSRGRAAGRRRPIPGRPRPACAAA